MEEQIKEINNKENNKSKNKKRIIIGALALAVVIAISIPVGIKVVKTIKHNKAISYVNTIKEYAIKVIEEMPYEEGFSSEDGSERFDDYESMLTQYEAFINDNEDQYDSERLNIISKIVIDEAEIALSYLKDANRTYIEAIDELESKDATEFTTIEINRTEEEVESYKEQTNLYIKTCKSLRIKAEILVGVTNESLNKLNSQNSKK